MSEFGDLAYGLFALQQPLTLVELQASAGDRRLPMSDAQTPEWFAAAAATDSSLLDMAPELQGFGERNTSAGGVDLVHIYAPGSARIDDDAAPPRPRAAAAPTAPDGTTVKFDLLKELADLED